MSDLIRKQQALKALRKLFKESNYKKEYFYAIDAVEDVPSAEPKRGKWKVSIKDVPEIKTLRGRNTISRELAGSMAPANMYDWLRGLVARDAAHKLMEYIDFMVHLDEDTQEFVIESSLSICEPGKDGCITVEGICLTLKNGEEEDE